MSTESGDVQDLFDRIAACKQRASPLKATGFRSTGTKYANEADLLSGHGAGAHGGRWNPRGLTAIYASLDPVTATKESYYELLQSGFPATVIRPRVMVGLAIDLKQVLNLTDGRIRRSLGLTVADLIEEDWSAIQLSGEEPWTQAIGRGAAEAGFEGILVPSARQECGDFPRESPERQHRRGDGEGRPAPAPEGVAWRACNIACFSAYLCLLLPIPSSGQSFFRVLKTRAEMATEVRQKKAAVGKPTKRVASVRGLHGVRLVSHNGKTTLELRDRLRMTREAFGRLVDVSVRTIATVESDRKKADRLQRDYLEVTRLCDALGEVVEPSVLGEWFLAPNKRFGGSKPIEIIERGEIDRLWEMVYRLRSGMPG